MSAHVVDTLVSKPRTPGTKGVARRLRASGWVPAVAYGPSSEAQHLALDPKVLVAARREHGLAHIYKVQVEGGATFKALIKEITRDPISKLPVHVDLYAVDMNKAIRLEVRIVVIGKAKGLIDGGILQQLKRSVEVSCLPGDIPDHLEVDVSELGIGDTIHIRDLVLPPGVKTTAISDEALVLLSAPTVEEEPVAAVAVEGEVPAAAGEAAAAPAEGEKKE